MFYGRGSPDAGIVDQDVEAAEVRHRRITNLTVANKSHMLVITAWPRSEPAPVGSKKPFPCMIIE